jgi:hypothetical protein
MPMLLFFGREFSLFFDKKIWEILDKYVFVSIISANFAIFEAKFAKIWKSQIWEK